MLAYLALAQRPVSRERLCDLLWEAPNDPKASVRWALARLRASLGDAAGKLLIKTKDKLEVRIARQDVDILAITDRLSQTANLSKAELEAIESRLCEPLLPGLDGAGSETFSLWLASERLRLRQLHAQVLGRLSRHSQTTRSEARLWDGRLRAQMGDDGADELSLRDPPPERLLQAPGRTASIISRPPVRYCRAPDGARIAYAVCGQGPVIIRVAHWLSHLEFIPQGPMGCSDLSDAASFTLVRYDGRGTGLSDRLARTISPAAMFQDLEAVVDAVGSPKVTLFGLGASCATAIAYAARRPDRVNALVLLGGGPVGWRAGGDPRARSLGEALTTLAQVGWDDEDCLYRSLFARAWCPDATNETHLWIDRLQRHALTGASAARLIQAIGELDVGDLLDRVTAPTLVGQALGDQITPVEMGRELATRIPAAQLAVLDSHNHLPLRDERAWEGWRETYRAFLRNVQVRRTS